MWQDLSETINGGQKKREREAPIVFSHRALSLLDAILSWKAIISHTLVFFFFLLSRKGPYRRAKASLSTRLSASNIMTPAVELPREREKEREGNWTGGWCGVVVVGL